MLVDLFTTVAPAAPRALPAHREYVHSVCRTRTISASRSLGLRVWCCHCKEHLPAGQFEWAERNWQVT